MNLYVSNLSYQMGDAELKSAFESYGTVTSARVIMDRDTGKSRGFGFVEMPVETEALSAINGLNNQAIAGRPVKVVEARPKEERPPRRDFGGGGGGGRKWDRDRGDRGDRNRGDRDDYH